MALLEAVRSVGDSLDCLLSRECENGRLFSLLVKLGFVNERPEHNMDRAWSETGDRYILKLFRDYVFHQVDTEGRPVLDMGHVVESLNKLDLGDQQRVLLSSRDSQSILLASFDDIKRCFFNAFADLGSAANPGLDVGGGSRGHGGGAGGDMRPPHMHMHGGRGGGGRGGGGRGGGGGFRHHQRRRHHN